MRRFPSERRRIDGTLRSMNLAKVSNLRKVVIERAYLIRIIFFVEVNNDFPPASTASL